jgi:hypothetical protein
MQDQQWKPSTALLRAVMKTHMRPTPYTFMLRKVLDSLDVIVSIDLDGNIRRMNDIYFRPTSKRIFEAMKS